MAVITISQGSFSGGRMLAEAVSRRLGYRCIDRQQLVNRAAEWGVSEEQLHTTMEKPPSFFGQSAHTKYRYLAFIQAALTEEVRKGNAIYHGLAAHLLLGKGQHVLRTRVIAPMAFRLAMVELKLGYSRKDAIAYIERKDSDRNKWTKFLYAVDWTDCSLYDLVINLEQMTLVDASDLLCAMVHTPSFETTPEALAALNDLAVSSAVKAHLAMDPEMASMEFEVTARRGTVSIKGEVDSPIQSKNIRALVAGLPDVQKVSVNELAVVTRI